VIDALGQPQSVLLLGGTSELGLAIVDRLVARRTTTVVLAGRDGEALETAATRLRAAGPTTVATVGMDATDHGEHARVLDEAFAAAGDVDLVIMAVGVLGDQEADEVDPARTAAVVDATFTGPAALLTAAADRLRRAGHGRILVLSSIAAVRVRRANYVYGSAKAGLDGFAQGLADALVGTGVSLQIVRPGFVVGKMTAGRDPAPFATTPAAVADAVVAGLADGRPVIWVPPVLRAVAVAFALLPRPVWRRLPG